MLFLCEILQVDKFEGPDWKYEDSFFIILPKKTNITHFWSKIPKPGIFGPKLKHFFFSCEILQLDKFEAIDFKYDNIVF